MNDGNRPPWALLGSSMPPAVVVMLAGLAMFTGLGRHRVRPGTAAAGSRPSAIRQAGCHASTGAARHHHECVAR